ncbi:copper-binding protein [Amycolatopsis pithecellobii]|uniref:Copper-binding protein n=1 Tax=Amycolatopsis pithecellobii TaxID=664692 RepID=A0A6N7YZQ4_9PSEU|nr:copper-binding protein [Amycolatopsis pithecellobii]MTD52961.1 copper-binding protein [Amycolatopsis pithecellobii]
MSIRLHPHSFAASVLALGAVAVVATGCGSSAPSSPATPPPAAGTAVKATLTDYRITLSQATFAPGTYTFTAVNAGSTPHALEINGPGVADQRTPGTIAPGQSSAVTVTLGPGSYEMWCPVDGHKDLGMDLTVMTTGGQPTAPSAPGGGY